MSKKCISTDEALEILYAEDSDDELIPELDSSDSGDKEDILLKCAEIVPDIYMIHHLAIVHLCHYFWPL